MIRFTRKVNVSTNYWELHVMIQMRDHLASKKSDKFKNTVKYVLKKYANESGTKKRESKLKTNYVYNLF